MDAVTVVGLVGVGVWVELRCEVEERAPRQRAVVAVVRPWAKVLWLLLWLLCQGPVVEPKVLRLLLWLLLWCWRGCCGCCCGCCGCCGGCAVLSSWMVIDA